jgi:hypothetical protein
MLKRFAVICLLLLGSGADAMAHHAWGNYDAANPITVAGPILTSKYEMPHVIITVQAPDKVWTVILEPPSRMLSRGARPEMLAVGKTISAYGYASRVNKDEMRADRIVPRSRCPAAIASPMRPGRRWRMSMPAPRPSRRPRPRHRQGDHSPAGAHAGVLVLRRALFRGAGPVDPQALTQGPQKTQELLERQRGKCPLSIFARSAFDIPIRAAASTCVSPAAAISSPIWRTSLALRGVGVGLRQESRGGGSSRRARRQRCAAPQRLSPSGRCRRWPAH